MDANQGHRERGGRVRITRQPFGSALDRAAWAVDLLCIAVGVVGCGVILALASLLDSSLPVGAGIAIYLAGDSVGCRRWRKRAEDWESLAADWQRVAEDGD